MRLPSQMSLPPMLTMEQPMVLALSTAKSQLTLQWMGSFGMAYVLDCD